MGENRGLSSISVHNPYAALEKLGYNFLAMITSPLLTNFMRLLTCILLQIREEGGPPTVHLRTHLNFSKIF